MPTATKIYDRKRALFVLTTPTEDEEWDHLVRINHISAQIVMGWTAIEDRITIYPENERDTDDFLNCPCTDLVWAVEREEPYQAWLSNWEDTHNYVNPQYEDGHWNPCRDLNQAQQLVDTLDEEEMVEYIRYLSDELKHQLIEPTTANLLRASACQITRCIIFAKLKR